MRKPEKIKWVFDKTIDFKQVVSMVDDDKIHSVLLNIAYNVISCESSDSITNSDSTYDMNSDMNSEVNSVLPSNDSDIFKFKLTNGSNGTTSIKLNEDQEVDKLFGDDKIFKEHLKYWEYIIALVLFLKGGENFHKKILNIFTTHDKDIKELFTNNPFYEPVDKFTPPKKQPPPPKQQQKQHKQPGGGPSWKPTGKPPGNPTGKPPGNPTATAMKSDTFDDIMRKYFKIGKYIQSPSIDETNESLTNYVHTYLHKSILPVQTEFKNIKISEPNSGAGGNKLNSEKVRLTKSYMEKITIKAFQFLYASDNSPYTYEVKEKIQKKITKFLIGYYSYILLCCNKALDKLGEPRVNKTNANASKTNANASKTNANASKTNASKTNASNTSVNKSLTIPELSKMESQYMKLKQKYKNTPQTNKKKQQLIIVALKKLGQAVALKKLGQAVANSNKL